MNKEQFFELIDLLPVTDEEKSAYKTRIGSVINDDKEVSKFLDDIQTVIYKAKVRMMQEDPESAKDINAALQETEAEIMAAKGEFDAEIMAINQEAEDSLKKAGEEINQIRMQEIKQEISENQPS